MDSKVQLEQRIANHQQRIDQSARAGQLGQTDATKLQAELDAIRKELSVDALSDGQLSDAEQAKLLGKLDDLSGKLLEQKNDQGAQFDARFEHAKSLIDAGEREGTLTKKEAEKLRTEQFNIRNSYLNARNGAFKESDAQWINGSIDKLEKKIDKANNNCKVDKEKRSGMLEKQIAEGERTGELTQHEATQLRKELEKAQKGCGGSKALSKVEQNIELHKTDSERSVEGRVKWLKEQLQEATKGERISAEEAKSLQAKLDELEAAAKKGDDAKGLNAQLDALSARILLPKRDPKQTLEQRTDDLQKRLVQGLKEMTLGQREAVSFQKELNGLRTQAKSLQEAGDKADADARAKLEAAFERLELRLATELAAAKAPTPPPQDSKTGPDGQKTPAPKAPTEPQKAPETNKPALTLPLRLIRA